MIKDLGALQGSQPQALHLVWTGARARNWSESKRDGGGGGRGRTQLFRARCFPKKRSGEPGEASYRAHRCHLESRLHAVPCFLLVIERLEGARCATARETGVSKVDGRASFLPILRAAAHLARSSLSITVDEKRKGQRAVYLESDCEWYKVEAVSWNPLHVDRE